MRRLIWAPVVLLCALAAVLGWQYGSDWAPVDETRAIELTAERHAADVDGARVTDCAARPGSGAVWLVVSCRTGGESFIYRLDERGRMMGPGGV